MRIIISEEVMLVELEENGLELEICYSILCLWSGGAFFFCLKFKKKHPLNG